MNDALVTDAIINHYRIVSKIGAGGTGEIFLGTDTKINRQAGLKILPAEPAYGWNFKEKVGFSQ